MIEPETQFERRLEKVRRRAYELWQRTARRTVGTRTTGGKPNGKLKPKRNLRPEEGASFYENASFDTNPAGLRR